MNWHCQINRIPPELLALIFSMVPSPLSHPSFPGPSYAKQTYELLPVTHVCRSWRALALDMPSLWSTVCETAQGHAASSTFRARAQQASLVIYVDRPRASVALTAILGYGLRLTELHLHDMHELSPAELAADLLGFPARFLERVVVRRRVVRAVGAGNDPAGSLAKPAVELFEGVAPKLSSLILHDLPFLPSNWFDALTHLKLSFEDSPVHWTLLELFQLLSQSQLLEDVRLIGLPTHLHFPDPPPALSVSLPCLRRLDVGDCRGQDSSIHLMRGILLPLSLPTFCAVRLYSVDAHRLSPLSDIRFPLTENYTTLDIEVTFTALALTASSPSGGSLRLELNTAGTTRTLLQQSIEAFVAGHPTAIETMTVASQRVWASWCDPNLLLCLLPNVVTLELADAHLVDQCLDALSPARSQSRECDGEVARDSCPRLETVRLPVGLTDLLLKKLHGVSCERALRGMSLGCVVDNREL